MVHRSGRVRHVRWHVTGLPSLVPPEVCLVGVDLTAERGLAERTRRAENLAILGTLAAGLAHEVRNPLNAAQLQLRLATRRLDPSAARAIKSIELVGKELGRLEVLVDDFLLYARPTPIELRSCDLCEVTRGVVAGLEDTAAERSVTLAVDAPETVALDCDEEQVRQVLFNLVDNAIDAAAMDGGGDVEIGVERRGPSALVTVSDSGPGLPDNIDVFAPFATSKEQGIGLGLPIVKRIIADHRGRLTVERRDARTVFEVELPIAAS